jgi:hypothetical protein
MKSSIRYLIYKAVSEHKSRVEHLKEGETLSRARKPRSLKKKKAQPQCERTYLGHMRSYAHEEAVGLDAP